MAQPAVRRGQPAVVIISAVLAYLGIVVPALRFYACLRILIAWPRLNIIVHGAPVPVYAFAAFFLALALSLLIGGIQLQRGRSRRALVVALVLAIFGDLVTFTNLRTLFDAFHLLGELGVSDVQRATVIILLSNGWNWVWPLIVLVVAFQRSATTWVDVRDYRPSPVALTIPAQALDPQRDAVIVTALQTYGERILAGGNPWVEATKPLAAIRGISTDGLRATADDVMRLAATNPWCAVGAWRLLDEYGMPHWRGTSLPGRFLDALTVILADPTSPPVAYRLSAMEAELVLRRGDPPHSPLWTIMPMGYWAEGVT